MTQLHSALAIRHVGFEDLGSLDQVLRKRDFAIEYLQAGVDDLARVPPRQFNLVVVLGGPIGAYETDQYPFLESEIGWLKLRLMQDLPTLGICLGAQLMARALGADVFPGRAGKEIGWGPLTAGDDADEHPYFAPLLANGLSVLHWHGDTFDLPQGARHLAASAQYRQQAFGWNHNGLALQFHPEVQAASFERWLIGHACELAAAPGVTPRRLRAEALRYAPALERVASTFWNSWLDHVSDATNGAPGR